jgi:predicted phosphodiesterase
METCSRVAVLSDVHGNAVALAAVLDELEAVSPDLVVFGGDLTWGPSPRESLALARELRTRAIFVRGNAERALPELAGTPGEAATPRERWLLEWQDDEERAFLASFVEG